MTMVTISPRFQLVIPRRIREQLALEPGQKVQAFAFGNRIELIPLQSPRSMRGFLRGMDTRLDRDDNLEDLADVRFFPRKKR